MQKLRKYPTKEHLDSMLTYDPMTGDFVWKRRSGTTNGIAIFNSTFGGKSAGKLHRGYRWISIGNVYYAAGRLAVIMSDGDPTGYEVDHENRIPHDNRLSNLRLATHKENAANTKRKSGVSKYGFIGIQKTKYGAFSGKLKDGCRTLYAKGSYATPAEAAMARDILAIQVRGDFAVLNFPRSTYWLTATNP